MSVYYDILDIDYLLIQPKHCFEHYVSLHLHVLDRDPEQRALKHSDIIWIKLEFIEYA